VISCDVYTHTDYQKKLLSDTPIVPKTYDEAFPFLSLLSAPNGSVLHTIRGATADIVIVDEVAAMDENVFYRAIVPILIVDGTAVVLLSTIQEGNNLFTRLMRLTYEDATPLFDTLELVYVCERCRAETDIEKNKIRKCKHMIAFLPKFHSRSQLAKLEVLAQGREADFARENLGMDIESNRRVFPSSHVNNFRKRSYYKIRHPVNYVFVSYDPHPGGGESEAAVQVTARINDIDVVSFIFTIMFFAVPRGQWHWIHRHGARLHA